ncbi:hypothetical protein DSO57_1026204 [Entomophthora muscae]|uniref:Uncharacterized protein n=1 Tax=Entomophthora muscae TaxID=34485 RepID=A0ACC2SFF1_9FUNG|nr:hypothetical protein DSO57_1026204 [Entomophthora muscae]
MAANGSTSTQLFKVMYITLNELVDSMVPYNGPWAVLGKSLSYIVKLGPILWWALPSGPADRLPTSYQEPPTGWIPDNTCTAALSILSQILMQFSKSSLLTLSNQSGLSKSPPGSRAMSATLHQCAHAFELGNFTVAQPITLVVPVGGDVCLRARRKPPASFRKILPTCTISVVVICVDMI